MDCEKFSKMTTDFFAGELDEASSKELLAHIEACEACRKEFDELKEIWTFTETALKSAKLSESLAPENYKAIFAAANEKPRLPWYKRLFGGIDLNLDIFDSKANRALVVRMAIMIGAMAALCALFLPALHSSKEKARRISMAEQLGQKPLGVAAESSDFSDSFRSNLALPKESPVASTVPTSGAKDVDASSVSAQAEPLPARKGEAIGAGMGRSLAAASPAAAPVAERSLSDAKSREAKELVSDELKRAPGAPPSAPMPKAEAVSEKAKKSAALRKAVPREEAALPVLDEKPMSQMIHYNGIAAKGSSREKAADKDSETLRGDVSLKAAEKIAVDGRQQAAAFAVAQNFAFKEDRDSNEPPAAKSYELNLKLWDMNTPEDAAKFLKARGLEVPASSLKILRAGAKGLISVSVPEEQRAKLEEIFETLRAKEDEQRELRDGLPLIDSKLKPVSTFSIDVDTASYTAARKLLLEGRRPAPESVRPEDFINYFDYNYKSPEGAVAAIQLEAAPSPFRPGNFVLRAGVQAQKLGPDAKRPSSFTVFVDSSGSMAQRGRLDLVKSSLRLLLGQLKGSDTISIIACGPEPEILIDHVPGAAKGPIERAISKLVPGGATNIERGFGEAYRLALRNYRPGAYNRVVVFTDGIGGLGSKSPESMLRQAEAARAKGVCNTIIGVGGDGDDKLLKELAAKGDGQYIFLDSEEEAQTVFSEQFAAKFRELARDVKVQIEFNPELAVRYRQVGYQSRQLSKDEFRDDKVDAGELGAGQSATALYELQLSPSAFAKETRQAPIATARLRYKLPSSMEVQEREFAISAADLRKSFDGSSDSFKLACAMSEFAERLRYPDIPGIANPGAIRQVLGVALGGDYSNDSKVKEAASLLDSLK